MDRAQHITQDAAEHYAVFLMAQTVEERGLAQYSHSRQLWDTFLEYLALRGWGFETEFSSRYPRYRSNVEKQIPAFVERLAAFFPDSRFLFQIDEANYRNQGLKADFSVSVDSLEEELLVSLKNYIGTGGVTRPQVSSGTFLSFAASFVFDRIGVGQYADPASPGKTFSGSKKSDRDRVLEYQGRVEFIPLLDELERLQAVVREDLLHLQHFDHEVFKEAVARVVPLAQVAIISTLQYLGPRLVRQKFLERIGLDRKEHMLFFDSERSIDSITNHKFRDLVTVVNDSATDFAFFPIGQSIRFEFSDMTGPRLQTDVPLTINTNGAWYRPRERFVGKRLVVDKKHPIHLAWGELRPHKSRELATSTNSYVNLKATGVFD